MCEQVCDGKYRKDYATVGKAYSMASVEFSGDHVCFEYVNRPTFHEGERKRTIIPFLFPVTLTFELLNYLLPQLLMHTAQVISNQFEFDVSTVLRFRKILRNSSSVVLSL